MMKAQINGSLMMFGKSPSGEAPADKSAEPLFRNAQAPQAAPRTPAAAQPAASELAASRPRTPVSTLSSALRIEGDLVGEADVQIDGHVKGDVRVSRLVIGPTAYIEGVVRAHHVEVRGRVMGSIEAQVVRLHESAHVEGDISHGQLAIESGAHFEGRVQPLRHAERIDASASEAAAAPEPAAERSSADVRPFLGADEPVEASTAEITAA